MNAITIQNQIPITKVRRNLSSIFSLLRKNKVLALMNHSKVQGILIDPDEYEKMQSGSQTPTSISDTDFITQQRNTLRKLGAREEFIQAIGIAPGSLPAEQEDAIRKTALIDKYYGND